MVKEKRALFVKQKTPREKTRYFSSCFATEPNLCFALPSVDVASRKFQSKKHPKQALVSARQSTIQSLALHLLTDLDKFKKRKLEGQERSD